jgi:phytanoyl-CoA hydroxylase
MMETSLPQTRSAASPASGLGDRFSASEVAGFQRTGFVIARGLADPEICRQMIDCTRSTLAAPFGPVEYEADLHYPGAPGSRAAAGGDTIRRLKEAHARDPVFTSFV